MTDANAIRFNIAFILWCALFLVLGGACLAALSAMERLPAPPVTATNCIDEKFKFLHETDIRNPGLIAVGSSVTWRNLDFSVFEEHYGKDIEPLNAAPCYLYVNQTAYLTDFLLDNMPSVKSVLSVFSMRDFSACSVSPTEFFRPEDAKSYVFDRDPSWHLYLKNFRPIGLRAGCYRPARHAVGEEHIRSAGHGLVWLRSVESARTGNPRELRA